MPYVGECLFIDNEPVVLVPKEIICLRYYFRLEQYFSEMVLATMQEERSYVNSAGKLVPISKKDLKKEILSVRGDRRKRVVEKTIENPELLEKYHRIIDIRSNGKVLTDEKLDKIIYEITTEESA